MQNPRGHLAFSLPHQLPLSTLLKDCKLRVKKPRRGVKGGSLFRTLNFLPSAEIRAEISPLPCPPSPTKKSGNKLGTWGREKR